jgi:hypothetical protein
MRMMRQAVVVAAVAFFSSGAGAMGAAWFTGTAASQPGPVALVAGAYDGTEPSAIQFSADGGDVVTGIRWSSWGSRTATGRGTVGWDNCTPNCAEGTTSYGPATVTLSAPDAHGEWTVVTETEHGRTTTFSLSGHWLQGATS